MRKDMIKLTRPYSKACSENKSVFWILDKSSCARNSEDSSRNFRIQFLYICERIKNLTITALNLKSKCSITLLTY